jgi:fucose permease
MPFPSANVLSTVHDISVPEVRSSATSIQYFLESGGAALSPLIIGIIADQSSLKNAFLIVCLSTWLLCAVFFAIAGRYVKKDVDALRGAMRERANQEKARHLPA